MFKIARSLFIFVSIFIALSITSASAAQHKQKIKKPKHTVEMPVRQSIVIDVATGRVLHHSNADRPAHPASLTKMMTLYMLFDALKTNKVQLDTKLRVSKKASNQAPSKLNLKPNSTITVEQAIQAMIVKSANDVAMVVAENLSGTADEFCKQMTQRAQTLGMTNTVFKNPNGLPNKKQISTAYDMALLARHLILDFPEQYSYFAMREFKYKNATIRGHNRFLDRYQGADGLKTGFTVASGFNLAASAKRNGQHLIAVVFGGPTAKARDDKIIALMDKGFNALQAK